MQRVVGQDAFHAADADRPSALHELLGDDLRRGVGVEKAMPDHLTDEFGRAAVVRLGAPFPALQCRGPLLAEGAAKLEVALLAEVELLGGL